MSRATGGHLVGQVHMGVVRSGYCYLWDAPQTHGEVLSGRPSPWSPPLQRVNITDPYDRLARYGYR